jgi:thymidylate synthase
MNKLDKDFQNILQDILDNGVKKGDRTGTGTLSVFGREIRHNMSDGFPLLTTKKVYLKGIVTELLWFLKGDTNIQWLVQNKCNIWNGDAYKAYEYYHNNHPAIHSNRFNILSKVDFVEKIKTDDDFAKRWGELGPVYGKQWRKWQGWIPVSEVHRMARGSVWFDQIGRLIHQLKDNPDSRRLMVNAWNVAEIDDMTLPPCHYGFQVYTRELKIQERMDWLNSKNNTDERYRTSTLDDKNVPKRAISLMWNQRSVDTFLGLPFNIASYGILLHILAREVNMVPGELIGRLGDTHLYQNHLEQAKEQISRESYDLPKLVISNNVLFGRGIDEMLDSCLLSDFQVEGYESHPTIKAPLSN